MEKKIKNIIIIRRYKKIAKSTKKGKDANKYHFEFQI